MGGSERVFQTLLERYPAARAVTPRFAASGPPEGPHPWGSRVELVGSGRGRRRPLRSPLYARQLAAVRLDGARVVLSLAHGGWSLAARVPEGARHVCYSHGLHTSLYGDTATH